MKSGFHGATTMHPDVQTAVVASAHPGYQTLELRIARVDHFLADYPLEDLKALLQVQRLNPARGGLGVAPLSDICTHFKGTDYDGPRSIELFRPHYWAWGPMPLKVKARDAAINVLSPYFEIE